MIRLFLISLLLIVSCKRTPPAATPAVCKTDADCFVTADECCPSCCGGPVRATTPEQFTKDRAACKIDDCDATKNENCDSKQCGHAIDEFQAVCTSGLCAVVNKPAPAPAAKKTLKIDECDTNTDCVVTTDRCCEDCCAAPVYAATQAALEKLHQQCALEDCITPKDCSKKVCPALQAVADYDALCKEHKCAAVVKRFGNTVGPNAQ